MNLASKKAEVSRLLANIIDDAENKALCNQRAR
jgi:hypothetical protein